jgi:CRP/FNR family transcriptional regulator
VRVTPDSLAHIPLLRELPTADLLWLADVAQRVDLSSETLLLSQGEPANHVYVVIRGLFRVFKQDVYGNRTLVLQFAGAGELLAEMIVFGREERYPVSVEAVQDSQVLRITRADFEVRSEVSPQLSRVLTGYLARRQLELLSLLERLVFLPVTARLAIHLLRLQADQGTAFLLPTNGQLAEQLGTVPEVVSRRLGQLYRSGCIQLDRRRVIALDLPRLLELVEASGFSASDLVDAQRRWYDAER